jgi:hypothetical protein
MATDMTRRSFLKFLGAATLAGSLTGTDVAETLWDRFKNWWDKKKNPCTCRNGKLCNYCKEKIITQALETDEGRQALAQAMVEPIRRSLEYQAVGRKILMVDELPGMAKKQYGAYLTNIVNKWAA